MAGAKVIKFHKRPLFILPPPERGLAEIIQLFAISSRNGKRVMPPDTMARIITARINRGMKEV